MPNIPGMPDWVRKIKSDMPILDRKINGHPLCYADSAATTLKPRQVIQAISDFYHTSNANIQRGIHTLGEEATTQYEQVRSDVAQFIGARQKSEIVFTHGATEGINTIAHAWGLGHIGPQDTIVTTELEHHANLLPWQWLAQTTGAQLIVVPVMPDGSLDMIALENAITSRTKLVAVTALSNVIGVRVNLAPIITRAHAVGAKVLVDAAQLVPHYQINVQDMGADFLVFSAHKMLGPTGVGVLYIRHELHDEISPYQRGGGTVFSVGTHTATFLPVPQLLEAGTPPIAQVIGLGAAIRYIKENIDFKKLARHEAALCAELIAGLREHKNIRILGDPDLISREGHMVSFVVDTMHAHDVAALFDSQGICVRAGHHCAQPLATRLGVSSSVRVSFYAYNSRCDVLRILEAIRL